MDRTEDWTKIAGGAECRALRLRVSALVPNLEIWNDYEKRKQASNKWKEFPVSTYSVRPLQPTPTPQPQT